ncbi:hypothetical protein QBC47DRAFT_278120, partial [Echria macrotheca]
NYEDQVCHPITQPRDTIPPCLELVTIETVCTPNGTSPLALKAHQQCMCTGSFFTEWPFCLKCLYIHGLRSERDVAYYQSILSTASQAFCDVPTPTAQFATIFDSMQYVVPTPTTGDTISSDMAPGETAVSLYFTATTVQGPGMITGDATGATAPPVLFTAPGSSASLALPSGGGGGGSNSVSMTKPTASVATGTGSGSAASSSHKSSTSSNAAAVPTGKTGGIGLAVVLG